MFNAWFSAMLLGFEASEVIRLRMMRIACGGEDACEEAHLMVSEKIRAALEGRQLTRRAIGCFRPHRLRRR